MSTKTSIKRVALIAVSALGFGLMSVVPAKAAPGAGAPIFTGSVKMVRSDQAASTSSINILAAGDFAATDTLTLQNFTRNGVALSTVPAGITGSVNGIEANLSAEAAAFAVSTATAGKIIFTTEAAKTPRGAVISVDKTMAPGKYTFDAIATDVVAQPDTVSATGTYTFYISTAPTKIALDAATYALDATDSAPNATLTITDAQGNPSYLMAGEALDVTITGGASTATKPTVSPVFVDSASYGNTVESLSLDLETSSATTGSYTLTVARAAGLTGVANATASITVGTTPSNATGLKIASGTYVNSVEAIGQAVADANFDGANDLTVLAAANNGFAYMSTASKSLTFTASTAATSGTMRWTIAATGGAVLGLPAGVTAGSTDVAIVTNAAGTYESSFTVTSTAPAAGFGYTVTVETAGADFGFQIVYQAPVPSKITTVDSMIAGGNVAAQKGATNSFAVTVADQFGQAIGGAGITFSSSGRQASSAGAVSAADGTATYSWTDASTATVTAAPTDTFTAALASPVDTAGFAEASPNRVQVTVNYADSLAAGTVTLVTNYDNATTGGGSLAYAAAIAADGTTALAVRADSTIPANGATDQVIVQATVTNAAGTAIPYAKVTFSGSAGVYFANIDSVTAANGLTSTATLVPVLASGKTTIDVYADGSGVAYAQARFTKKGSGSVTATSLGATSTAATVNVATAGSERFVDASLAGNIVSAVVTDGFGNAVSGVTVTFTVSNGTFLTGANLVQGATDSAGKSTAALATGTGLSVKVAITGGQSAAAADANVTGFAAGIASETVTTDSVTAEQTAAEAATEAAVEATDAANQAYEAAVVATETAEAAVAAAEDAKAAADAATAAVEALATQVSTMMAELKAQVTKLAKAVAKILKRV